SERLGPYESEDQASHAFEIARKRNEDYDAAEKDWGRHPDTGLGKDAD
ncbi:MAG: hypothetical protein IPG68_14285, partial [Micrococcales bacterium]|nr:hypothetical protein [Micrococcales bacterium]